MFVVSGDGAIGYVERIHPSTTKTFDFDENGNEFVLDYVDEKTAKMWDDLYPGWRNGDIYELKVVIRPLATIQQLIKSNPDYRREIYVPKLVTRVTVPSIDCVEMKLSAQDAEKILRAINIFD